MSKYRFAQKSQLPPSTLRCILKKEDYDIGERNILKENVTDNYDNDIIITVHKGEISWALKLLRKLGVIKIETQQEEL